MKLATIGVGNAGSKIVDRMLKFEQETNRNLCRHSLAINSARTDLRKPDLIPENRRVLIGDTNLKAKGHGVGGDSEVGAEVAREDIDEIRNAMNGVAVHEVDALLVVAGLGGGTGSGAGPVIIEELQDMYSEPVYALGILPGESEGGRPALNAARSLQTFVRESDNFIAFDNDAWRQAGQSIEAGYAQTNSELATRIVTLLAAGELDESEVAENAMDSSDIIRTLDTGGVSSIAYASYDLGGGQGGLLSRWRDGEDSSFAGGTDAAKIQGLVRQAVNARLTLPCQIDSADRVLVVLSGPPSEFSRKGLEAAREWLEEQTDTVEVLAGDDPRRRSRTLAAAVLLSGVTDAPRIEQMQNQGVEAQEKIEAQDAVREEETEDLITDADDRLDPIS